MMRIIDSHCHYGKGDGFTGPWDTNAPLQPFLNWSVRAGIQQTVLFAPFHSDYRAANRVVGALVNKDPGKYFGYAFVHASRDKGRLHTMVEEAIRGYHCCGIKAHRYDAPISRELAEVAQAFNLPVLYDVMGEVATVDLFAREYPRVNFIIPHLGSFADDWKAQRLFVDLLTTYPNVYTDSSGVRRFELLQLALDKAGAGKILFGTDGPWLHPEVELTKILALEASEQDKIAMLSGNFLKLTKKAREKISLA